MINETYNIGIPLKKLIEKKEVYSREANDQA